MKGSQTTGLTICDEPRLACCVKITWGMICYKPSTCVRNKTEWGYNTEDWGLGVGFLTKPGLCVPQQETWCHFDGCHDRGDGKRRVLFLSNYRDPGRLPRDVVAFPAKSSGKISARESERARDRETERQRLGLPSLVRGPRKLLGMWNNTEVGDTCICDEGVGTGAPSCLLLGKRKGNTPRVFCFCSGSRVSCKKGALNKKRTEQENKHSYPRQATPPPEETNLVSGASSHALAGRQSTEGWQRNALFHCDEQKTSSNFANDASTYYQKLLKPGGSRTRTTKRGLLSSCEFLFPMSFNREVNPQLFW